MFLIQQSSSFRVWTSRALMVYFRRALLFLVVSPRQNAIQHRILSQERQKVCFSDAEDDEETTMNDRSGLADSLLDQREDSTNRMQISQLKKCIGKELAQAINNSMSKSIEKETDQSLVIVNFEEPSDPEQVEPSANDLNQGSKTFSIKTAHHRQIDENKQSDDSVSPPRQHLFSHHHSHFNGTDSIPFSPVSRIDEKGSKIYDILVYSPAIGCPLCLTRKSSRHHRTMKKISMKNTRLRFGIFSIKPKASIPFVKKISYIRCSYLNRTPPSSLSVPYHITA